MVVVQRQHSYNLRMAELVAVVAAGHDMHPVVRVLVMEPLCEITRCQNRATANGAMHAPLARL